MTRKQHSKIIDDVHFGASEDTNDSIFGDAFDPKRSDPDAGVLVFNPSFGKAIKHIERCKQLIKSKKA